MAEESRSFKYVTALLILVSCISGFIYCVQKPIWNWDALGYAAAVESLTESDKQIVHQRVYSALKAHATDETWFELTASTEYRKTMYEDADAFSQQIPYYKIRVIFILLLLLFTKLGIDIFVAGHVLTAAFYSLGVLVFYVGLRKHAHSALWLLLPVLMFIFTQELILPRHVAVDSLGFFCTALVVCAFVNRYKWLYLALAVMVLVRTDLIIMSALIFGACWLIEPSTRKTQFFYGTLTIAFYLAVNHWADNYGWHALFYFVFVSDMAATHPETYSSYKVSWSEYLQYVLESHWIGKSMYLSGMLVGLNSILFGHMYLHRGKKEFYEKFAVPYLYETQRRIAIISFVSGGYVALHYLLFPLLEGRFFLGCYVAVTMGFLILSTNVLAIHKAQRMRQVGEITHG